MENNLPALSPNIRKIFSDPNFKLGMALPPSKSHLTSIASFISKKGGKFEEGMRVVLEKTMNKLENAILVGWDISYDERDPFNFGYYHTSKADVLLTSGELVKYPFSMIFVEKQSFNVLIHKKYNVEIDLFREGGRELTSTEETVIRTKIQKEEKVFGNLFENEVKTLSWRRLT